MFGISIIKLLKIQSGQKTSPSSPRPPVSRVGSRPACVPLPLPPLTPHTHLHRTADPHADSMPWTLQAAEPGTNFRATTAARAAPSPAFKRLLPTAAASTPLKTAALRTSMAAFSGQSQFTQRQTGNLRVMMVCMSTRCQCEHDMWQPHMAFLPGWQRPEAHAQSWNIYSDAAAARLALSEQEGIQL